MPIRNTTCSFSSVRKYGFPRPPTLVEGRMTGTTGTMSDADRIARAHETELQEMFILAGEATDNRRARVVVYGAMPFIATPAEAQRFAVSFEHCPAGKNLVVLLFAQGGKIKDADGALVMARLVDRTEIWGQEAMQAVTVAASPLLVIDDGQGFNQIITVLDLAHALGAPVTVHQTLAQAAGRVLASFFYTADILAAELLNVPCSLARNEALVAYARRFGEAGRVLLLEEGFKLIKALTPRPDNSHRASQMAIVNAMIPGLRVEGVAYPAMLQFAHCIINPIPFAMTDDTREAEEAFVAVSAPHIRTAAQAVFAALHLRSRFWVYRVLAAFMDRCGDVLPNPEAALALATFIYPDDFGGRELEQRVAASCARSGFDFDLAAFRAAVDQAFNAIQEEGKAARAAALHPRPSGRCQNKMPDGDGPDCVLAGIVADILLGAASQEERF